MKQRPRLLRTLKHYFFWMRKHQKAILLSLAGTFAIWLIFAITIGLLYQRRHANDPLIVGVSFSKEYSQELGNDWRQNFTELLDDASFRHFRLMSYWDELEPEKGAFNFADLDWQMDQAAKRGAKVTLAIGERQPRWPECRRPAWAEMLPTDQKNQAVNAFISQVAEHYKHHPALESYQLENEVANRLFSPHCEKFDRKKLQAEYNAVKATDPYHPLIINTSNQSGVPVFGPIGDGVGFSIYKKAYVKYGPFNFYWSYNYTPTLWHSYRAALTELSHPGTKTFVHELQAEPWGPVATKDLSQQEQRKSMTPEGIAENVIYTEKTGMKTMYLWGSEWWYWQKHTNGDSSFWDTAKGLSGKR